MDPLTQGALGAAFAQAAPSKTKNTLIAGGLGFAAGMAADLDALIRSPEDPFIFLEYHRHFTHSLAFIPFGGLLCALALHWIVGQRWKIPFIHTFIFCAVGYATHGLLDASTSYGTMLLWPFSEDRISWSIVPIVDPLFTLPLVAFVFVSAKRQSRMFAYMAVCWVGLYLSLGALQHNAAMSMGKEIAIARGHAPNQIHVKPSFANILVWKTIYEEDQHFFVDAVRVGLGSQVFYGVSIPKLNVIHDLPWLDLESQQARDIERFSTFSQSFLAADPENPNRIVDIRYSFLPNEINPLWSISVSPTAERHEHAKYLTHRENAREGLGSLWQMISRSKRALTSGPD